MRTPNDFHIVMIDGRPAVQGGCMRTLELTGTVNYLLRDATARHRNVDSTLEAR